MSKTRSLIEQTLRKALKDNNLDGNMPLEEGTVLLEIGIDSLGFAILIARLETELGYDPFTLDSEAYYPSTYGEFVRYYEKFAPSDAA